MDEFGNYATAIRTFWLKAEGLTATRQCIAPGSLDTSLSHAAGLSDIAVCHA